jgi:hypothetical protein
VLEDLVIYIYNCFCLFLETSLVSTLTSLEWFDNLVLSLLVEFESVLPCLFVSEVVTQHFMVPFNKIDIRLNSKNRSLSTVWLMMEMQDTESNDIIM